ncbi:MAG: 23S rRNA (guanosine(2251)-2'-O)-methyltransferase RlmB [Bacillota bacterium]|nr:23S rRNA (guanosine(2251)-2'-O)-methyltransferase RlmB [Bacillota bacterium]
MPKKDNSNNRSKKEKGKRPYQKSSSPRLSPDKKKYDLIWGRQPVLEALRAGLPLVRVEMHEAAFGGIIKEIIQKAGERGVFIDKKKLLKLEDDIPGQNHQGVIAYMEPYEYLIVQDLLEKAMKGKKVPFFVMLDHIQDPQNFGSLIRTACAAGVDGIIIPRDRACGVTSAVFKSSAGSLAYVPVAQAVNLTREVEYLKKEGFWLVGADMSGEKPFFEADFTIPLVLILGSEGKGLSRLLREKCDLLLRIPIVGEVSSLNVAVAGGIILYEVFRQRSNR